MLLILGILVFVASFIFLGLVKYQVTTIDILQTFTVALVVGLKLMIVFEIGTKLILEEKKEM